MAAAALADGAGSRARSELGAEAAVRATLRLLVAQFEALYEQVSAHPAEACKVILETLLNELQKAAQQHGCEIADLASTLLFVAHKGDRFFAGHLGDGVIALVNAIGEVSTLSGPDNGEFANTTVFVTDRSACEKMRLYHGEYSQPPIGYALMSDGTAESLYDKRTQAPAAAIAKLLTWNSELSRVEMHAILGANMEQAFSRKTADDCSLALLSIAT